MLRVEFLSGDPLFPLRPYLMFKQDSLKFYSVPAQDPGLQI